MSAAPLPAWVFEARRRACAGRLVQRGRKAALKPRSDAAGVCAPALPRARARRGRPGRAADPVGKRPACACGRLPGGCAHRHAVVQEPMHAIGPTCWTACSRRWRAPSATTRRPGDLAAKRPFSVGANLQQVAPRPAGGEFDLLEKTVAKFQQTSMTIKHARCPSWPRCRAWRWAAAASSSCTPAHPGGAGELHRPGRGRRRPDPGRRRLQGVRPARAALAAAHSAGGDVFPSSRTVFQTIAMANVSKSALEAQELGFLPNPTTWCSTPTNPPRGARRARAWPNPAGGRRWSAARSPVAGRNGIATCEMMLVNMRRGRHHLGARLPRREGRGHRAVRRRGRDRPQVSEQWLLEVERAQFVELLKTEKTQQRIAHMLETGKPLRN
jgi:3-hydroxyacyl-CoA dehydrogenase